MFSRLERENAPFAAAVAANNVLFAAMDAERAEMRRVFDRPTRYTLNSMRVEKASKRKLEGRLWVKTKSDAGKGTSPENYLVPQIEGGARHAKRFEVALRRIGVLPSGWLAVPGQGATLDAFGNMSRGQISQILAYFGALQDDRSNLTEAKRAKLKRGTKRKYGIAYFAAIHGRKATRGLQPGIYKRIFSGFGTGVVPVLIFVRSATYHRRLDFHGVADRYVKKHFRAELDKQMRRAIATSR